MSEFDDATTLVSAESDGGTARFTATIDDRWRIGEAVNGGLVMSLLAKAATSHPQLSALPDAVSLAAVFSAPTAPGPAEVTVQIVRAGRRFGSVAATLSQDGAERARALVTVGDLSVSTTDPVVIEPPIELPDPDDCLRTSEAPVLTHSTLLQRISLALDPTTTTWAEGKPAGRGEMRGWFEFTDGREPDALSLLLVLDAMPPTAFDLGIMGWVPTVEFTGHVLRRPTPGPLRVRTHTPYAAGGTQIEDAQIWDSSGALVAVARQLATYRPPQD
ncbi:thioesterase family protein [Calidifontibacter sp. DB0510]|uniref:Thioesterase family protein n=1 Tax=Metallococcus carri TaxID=1656884 RepID=A0A967E9N5_9MICO|nr:thioesterase family protein [Metallococcus carri]NHN55039.1 thioesterase family protein [Metallococcus carri]NOP37385.1 thioesterase family protein [Calidifontibacter sp. DB2511S]